VLDLRRLRALQAVGREGSFSAAARALDYTQPAITHHIRRLEAELGTPLVLQRGRGIDLTPAGSALARRADLLLAGVAAAEEEVQVIAGLSEGRVRLVAFPSANGTIVPPALAALRREHPGLEVALAEAEPPESLALLSSGEADVCLAFTYPGLEQDDDPSLHTANLVQDEQLAVLPGEHSLASAAAVDLADLREETWIAGCPRCRGQLLHLCSAAGFEPRIVLETDDYVAVQGMVAAGLGVALLPALSLGGMQRDDVSYRPVRGRPRRTITCVTAAGAQTVPAVAALLDALGDAAPAGSAT
jgi:DNA-binding transcriptional LysR family regulator